MDTPGATKIETELLGLRDENYREFNSRLLPTVEKSTIIGVRVPELRKIAKRLCGTPEGEKLLSTLPHRYFEENLIHGYLLEQIKDFDTCIAELERFLPYVDNWAVCDGMHPKVFKTHKAELLTKIKEWLSSGRTYTVRFGLSMLMSLYLDEDFKPEYLELAATVPDTEYYVSMMIGWLFATALAKQYDSAVCYLENQRLSRDTHNRTIQKALESYRVSGEHKAYLKTLKRK